MDEIYKIIPKDFEDKYLAYEKAKAEYEEVYDKVKSAILGVYKNGQDVPKSFSIGDIKATYVSPSVRKTIDKKRLEEELPEIAEKFTKITNVDATLKLTR